MKREVLFQVIERELRWLKYVTNQYKTKEIREKSWWRGGVDINPFQEGLIGVSSRIGGGGGVAEIPSLPKMCYAYSTTMELGTAIPYIKKIQRIYESHDTHFNFYWH